MAMMNEERFCVFVLCHNRPKLNVSLRLWGKCLKNTPFYVVVSDDDPQLETYKTLYQEKTLIFNKKEIMERENIDLMFNNPRYDTPIFARYRCFWLARELGYENFVVLDDDCKEICFYEPSGKRFRVTPSKDDKGLVYKAVCATFKLLNKTNLACVAWSQLGDTFPNKSKLHFRRKAMNTWFCKTGRTLDFKGFMNEDTVMYANRATKPPILQIPFIAINQATTQTLKGGMTNIYKHYGTYAKSMLAVIERPDCVKLTLLKDRKSGNARIHHKIDWNLCVPKIVKQ